MHRRLFIGIWSFWAVFVFPARADELDDLISAEMKRQNVPGLALTVVKEGRVVKAKGYGFANLEHRVPVTPETVFQSASMGKMFTAAGILLLAQDGKLSLDDPVGKHLAEGPAHWRPVTIRHLLNHTSGIPDFPYEDRSRFDLRRDYTDAELVALAGRPPLSWGPGEKWSYCNAGYVLLGIVMNRVTGRSYGDFLERRIFHPLEMKGARVLDEAAIIPHRAAGYERAGSGPGAPLRNQTWVSPVLNTAGDGSLYLSIADMAKWDLALDGERVLPAAIKSAMWAPTKLKDGTQIPYGYGWRIGEYSGRKHVGHDGSWQGFVTVYDRYPEHRVSVIILSNAAATKLEPFRVKAAEMYAK